MSTAGPCRPAVGFLGQAVVALADKWRGGSVPSLSWWPKSSSGEGTEPHGQESCRGAWGRAGQALDVVAVAATSWAPASASLTARARRAPGGRGLGTAGVYHDGCVIDSST